MMAKGPPLMTLISFSIHAKVRARIAEDCGWVCQYCGDAVAIGFRAGDKLATIDHKIPLARGGSSKRFNLTCACYACNQAKADMTDEEFIASRTRTDQ